MRFEHDAISKGLDAAFERTKEHFDVNRRRIDEVQRPLMGVLESWPGEAHRRFVTLFAELWAIAAIARLANGEPALTEEQIRGFLDHSFDYFNSFKHK
jgi:hypothetical protein